MACGDNEVGRWKANQVNIRGSNVLDAVYQVSIGLSGWLRLHDVARVET